ncbi:MAG TPA: peptidoglycan DD-metalloendopeptidase family protein [Candidatus Methylomirabilis sp.]|nr:peptidoglycan DD-metalloendopeptidase family protein [Candidatus Methylomirabilis sp.]
MRSPSEPEYRVGGFPQRVLRGVALGLVAILGLPGFTPAAEVKSPRSQQSREQLKELQRELGRERQQAKAAVRREASLAKELSGLDEDLKRKTKQLRELEVTLRDSTQKSAKLSREIAVTEGQLVRSRGLLKRRLRAIYKQGRFGYVRMLLSADDFSSVGRRLKYLSALATQDQRLMQSYSATLADLSQKRSELEKYKAQVAEATEKAAVTRSQIEQEQRKRRILLASVREEKAGHLAAIKELERSAKDLQALIARLQSEEARQRRANRAAPQRQTPGGKEREDFPDIHDDGRFAQLKGKLPWPAAGPLVSTFGRQEHPRFHTITFNRGIEIGAPAGKDIAAVADGTVIYADWFKGYGRLLILDHGGGYFTLYAHAAEILAKAGDSVTRGQVIGRVGDTGSLEGPQLYFELRHKGKPQDPVVWLQPR